MFSFFTSNKKRRRKTTRGNFLFRRKRPSQSALHRLELNRLDLNPETDATRRERLIRRAGTGARWAFGILAVIMFCALMKVVINEAFINNQGFRLQKIDVHTAGPLSESAVYAIASPRGDTRGMSACRATRPPSGAPGHPIACTSELSTSVPGRAKATEDAQAQAKLLRSHGLSCALIDTSPQPQPTARTLADAMQAVYLPLPHADAAQMSGAVRAMSGRAQPARARAS